ncbi:Dehydrogenase/reductase SDR family member 13 [Hondaea fermentalgiana]|uniref:Dehydrogenase/reductase SDR family member 13 n=1 Tax=Hondaea fermentalgiana TaxID=2315210 RepID=A0A2R5G2P3_9STRA|nr:Dehydrogenase/reductase SDR family member 13 [Hondaea fermentalgiana]|eukprot:GBG24589.1 Dehydrogenase/reductase SDR family member 13 [Hondaea fermentalgiana]
MFDSLCLWTSRALVGYLVSCFAYRLSTFEYMPRKEALGVTAWVAAIFSLSSGKSPVVQGELAYAALLPAILLSFRFVWRQQIRGPPPGQPVGMKGRTVIVTGSNSGIGVETARGIAAQGAKVIMACRTKKTADAACADIIKTTGNKDVSVMELDMGSFKSIRAFAAAFTKEHNELDVLVHNAGVMLPSRKTTGDGLDMMMQVNCFSVYLLTLLLLPLLRKSTVTAGARVVLVSSTVHIFPCVYESGFDFEDPMCENKKYVMLPRYGHSKLGLELFRSELHRRLRAKGDTIRVNTLSPGSIATGITRSLHWFLIWGQRLVLPLVNKTVRTGANTTIHVATAAEIASVSGEFFEHCEIVPQHDAARDAVASAQLWELAEKLTGFKSEEVGL